MYSLVYSLVYSFIYGYLLVFLSFQSTFFFLYSLCDSHYVDIFKGSNTNGSPFKSLCGYIGSSEVVTRDKGKHLTLEFV